MFVHFFYRGVIVPFCNCFKKLIFENKQHLKPVKQIKNISAKMQTFENFEGDFPPHSMIFLRL